MNDDEALAWCRQALLIPGSPLAVTLSYAPESRRDAMVALRAVIAEIARVADEAGELEVAQARLAWWRQALHEPLPHPAVQAWHASGGPGRVPAAQFDALISGVEHTLAGPRFENREQAWQHCQETGGVAWGLEADLIGAGGVARAALAELGAAAYAIRLVRDLAIDARNNRWLVPLDLQAAYQVARPDAIHPDRPATRFNGMVRAWLDDTLGRCDRALRNIAAPEAWHHRHLLIQHALDRRLALKLARRPRRIRSERIVPGHVGNAWCAWRCARGLERAARRAIGIREFSRR